MRDISIDNYTYTTIVFIFIDKFDNEFNVNFSYLHEHLPFSVAMKTTESLVDLAMRIDSDLKKVKLASGDKFVAGLEAKTRLGNDWQCDIVDMEGAAIALACHLYGADFLMIKAVSDALTEGGAEFYENFERTSRIAVGIIDDIIKAL